MSERDDRYRIFGSELSPYSVKVRSYFRYKGLPHEWIIRSAANMAEFQRHAKLPLIPLVLTPDGRALQDSTPIIEHLEGVHPEPWIHPPDPISAFVSALLEEYGDEWGNKWMFHYRWTYEADQDSAAERIARDVFPDASDDERRGTVAMLKERMIPRLSFVGSSDETRPTIEASFARVLELLEVHLGARPFLFGARPAFADFGLWPQLYQCASDPTPRRAIVARAPAVLAWIERMVTPVATGAFESWRALAPTLLPLLREDVGRRFLPWSAANARALTAGDRAVEVELDGVVWRQEPQKYHAKSLGALRARYAAVHGDDELERVLEGTGCLAWLT
jgi:glutathione S-transferase